jgi:sugar phosphate isomerase/epimerase
MKIASSIAAIALTATLSFLLPSTMMAQGSFMHQVGLQLYSLRAQFKQNGVPATLDQVKNFGITEVELAGTYDMKPADFLAELKKRNLKPISEHFPYKRLKTDLDNVVQEAKALELQFAGCAWIDHKGDFTEEACRDAIATFNKAGAALAKEGIKCFYHTHGYEFQPYHGGTLFDMLVKGTDVKNVGFQMDVMWVVFPGQDPVKLLEKYPDRWVSMHLKDLKKGVATGSLAGKTDVSNDVTIGSGQMDWPAILQAAQKTAIKYYFIEDESPTSVEQIPNSLKFLKTVKW